MSDDDPLLMGIANLARVFAVTGSRRTFVFGYSSKEKSSTGQKARPPIEASTGIRIFLRKLVEKANIFYGLKRKATGLVCRIGFGARGIGAEVSTLRTAIDYGACS